MMFKRMWIVTAKGERLSKSLYVHGYKLYNSSSSESSVMRWQCRCMTVSRFKHSPIFPQHQDWHQRTDTVGEESNCSWPVICLRCEGIARGDQMEVALTILRCSLRFGLARHQSCYVTRIWLNLALITCFDHYM